VEPDFILHPLIHTFLKFAQTQDALGGRVDAVEKKTPISQLPNRWGYPYAFGVNPMLTPQMHSCKPDAKKKPPLTSPVEANGGIKPAQGYR